MCVYPACHYSVLEHAAHSGSQCPALSLHQSLHTALSRQQRQVRQTSIAMETKQLTTEHCYVYYILNDGDWEDNTFCSDSQHWSNGTLSRKHAGKSYRQTFWTTGFAFTDQIKDRSADVESVFVNVHQKYRGIRLLSEYQPQCFLFFTQDLREFWLWTQIWIQIGDWHDLYCGNSIILLIMGQNNELVSI